MNASLKINYHYYTTHHYEVQLDKREQQSQSMVTHNQWLHNQTKHYLTSKHKLYINSLFGTHPTHFALNGTLMRPPIVIKMLPRQQTLSGYSSAANTRIQVVLASNCIPRTPLETCSFRLLSTPLRSGVIDPQSRSVHRLSPTNT